nr:uncharacterized protein LOC110380446 [Helicoverpa armigera]
MESRRDIRTTAENETERRISKNPRFNLHLVQKATEPSDRPMIDCTKFERLSFYRSYTSSPIKIELVVLSHLVLNDYIWFYVLNLFLKSLPHSFLHFFMASYAPEEHIFLTKMVPVCHGFKYLLVVAAFFELLLYSSSVIQLFHFSLDGLASKNPWNRCKNATYFDVGMNETVHCYNFEYFGDILFNNSDIIFDKFKLIYVDANGTHFSSSVAEYYRTNVILTTHFSFVRDLIYFVMLWSVITYFHNWAEKRTLWRALNVSHWVTIAIDVTAFLYLISVETHKHENEPAANSTVLAQPPEYSIFSFEYWSADVDLIAESISAPPVVHILTARSTQEINPGTDCATMVISNTLLYFLKSLVFFEIKTYVESFAHSSIHMMDFYQRTWFFYWPLFYSHFYFGNVYTIVFMFCTGVNEFLVMIVTYHCLIQTVIYEWPKFQHRVKIWFFKVPFVIFGVVVVIFTNGWYIANFFIASKALITVVESVFLYLLYPLGRLVDDYTFHYGTPPTRLRILNLRLVPVYYAFKYYFMMNATYDVLSQPEVKIKIPYFLWSWPIMAVPLFLGVLWIIYKYLVRQRMTWQYIFRPIPKWGPRDFSERQLRKQYSSKYYISSEVPKLLSRYLMSKRESKVYKVDVRYDMQRRSTVSKAVGFSAPSKKNM